MVEVGNHERRGKGMNELGVYLLKILWLLVTIIVSFVIGWILVLGVLSFIILIFTIPLKENWNLELPSTCELIESFDEGVSFHGDGIRYGRYNCSSDDDLSNLVLWKEGRDATIEADVWQLVHVFDQRAVKRIPFDEPYLYEVMVQDENQLYMIWFKLSNELFVVEQLN